MPVADDFLPSLYRSTLVFGMLFTVGIVAVTRSSIWAGSFFFGALASLAFLKAQEVFLKRLLTSNSTQPAAAKTPKSLWIVMVGKYFLLAGIMAAALHFQILNLIAFVFGFALLHVVMVIKVVSRRTENRWSFQKTVTDAPHHRIL
jgi:hypothetical protein